MRIGLTIFNRTAGPVAAPAVLAVEMVTNSNRSRPRGSLEISGFSF